ncbi:MAG: MerC family mercury resistance protein [Myxococcota bacterium]
MTSEWMDRLGSVASATCAAHCLLLALAPALITVLGVEFLRHEAFEWGFFTLAVSFAVVAAALGYRIHRSGWVLAGFGGGLLLLLAGRLGEALALHEGSVALAVLGGVTLVTSHIVSIRQSRAAQVEYCR